jgi:hypothetical protein
VVLGEGLRLVNAHPVAHAVFWGGATNWLLAALLAGHAVNPAVRAAVLLTSLALWVVVCLARVGGLAVVGASVQAVRKGKDG